MPKKINKISGNDMTTVGVGMAAAGAYYLLGPKGKQHRKKAGILAKKLKSDIKKEIKKRF